MVEAIYLVSGLMFSAHFKGRMPEPTRVFDHPDRPTGPKQPKPKGKPRLATPADLEAWAQEKEGKEVSG